MIKKEKLNSIGVMLSRNELRKVTGGLVDPEAEKYMKCHPKCTKEAENVPSGPYVPPGTTELTYASCMSACLNGAQV